MLTRILSTAALLLGLSTAATVKDCGAGTSLFIVNKLGLDPVNPTPGQEISLLLDYTVPEGTTVVDGTTTYQITLNFIPFAPSTNPLCQDIPCPLGPGAYSNITKSTWPSGVSGSFTSKMVWSNPESQTLLCILVSGALEYPLMLPAPPSNTTPPLPLKPLEAFHARNSTTEEEDEVEEPAHPPSAKEKTVRRIRGGHIQA